MFPGSLSPVVKVMVMVVPAPGVNKPVRRLDSDGLVSAAPANDRLPFGVAGGGSVGTMVSRDPAPVSPGRYFELFHE